MKARNKTLPDRAKEQAAMSSRATSQWLQLPLARKMLSRDDAVRESVEVIIKFSQKFLYKFPFLAYERVSSEDDEEIRDLKKRKLTLEIECAQLKLDNEKEKSMIMTNDKDIGQTQTMIV